MLIETSTVPVITLDNGCFAEVDGFTFSDSASSPVPKFLNPGLVPGLAILQI